MESTKTCSKCGISKPLDEFNNQKTSKDGKRSECKECVRDTNKKYYQNHKEEAAKWHKEWYEEHKDEIIRKEGNLPMYENKYCTQYLGIVVAERLVKHVFKDVEMMPFGFPGYDLICNKGKKINVKASTAHVEQNKSSTMNRWQFRPNYNKKCDYFLCMAFDNVDDLNPLYMWMIPAIEINHKSSTRISQSTIHKWDQWIMDINNTQTCCATMKEKSTPKITIDKALPLSKIFNRSIS